MAGTFPVSVPAWGQPYGSQGLSSYSPAASLPPHIAQFLQIVPQQLQQLQQLEYIQQQQLQQVQQLLQIVPQQLQQLQQVVQILPQQIQQLQQQLAQLTPFGGPSGIFPGAQQTA